MKSALLSSLLLLCAHSAHADPVIEWNALMIDAIRVDNSGPTLSSRNLAILHTAIYDAVNSIAQTHQPFLVQLNAPAQVSIEAAVTGAGHFIAKALYPSFSARSEELFQRHMAKFARDAAMTNGLALGEDVARLALLSREADGANTEVPYIPSALPGQWQRTPPFFRPPVAPHWRYVDFFGIPEINSFLSPPPPTLDSAEYAAALNEVKEIGGKNSTVRTEEQRQIAVFWSDFSYTSMPPGHWHLIVASILGSLNASLEESARLFALVSIAQADSAVVCWEAKYRWNFWRPVTAVRRAGEDNNPATVPDETWDALLAAPPFPSYFSGHSTFSKASAQVIANFYRTDAIQFTATSDSLPGVTRNFTSLSACADEVGMSRIYGGIHYSFDNVEGKKAGMRIGNYIADNWLLPNEQLPLIKVERASDGKPRMRIHARVGERFVLEGSPDLLRWSKVGQGTGASGGVSADFSSSGAQRFYFFRVSDEDP